MRVMVRLDPTHLLRGPRWSREVTGIFPRTNDDPPVQLPQSLRFALRGAQPFDSGLAALGLRSWQAIRRGPRDERPLPVRQAQGPEPVEGLMACGRRCEESILPPEKALVFLLRFVADHPWYGGRTSGTLSPRLS